MDIAEYRQKIEDTYKNTFERFDTKDSKMLDEYTKRIFLGPSCLIPSIFCKYSAKSEKYEINYYDVYERYVVTHPHRKSFFSCPDPLLANWEMDVAVNLVKETPTSVSPDYKSLNIDFIFSSIQKENFREFAKLYKDAWVIKNDNRNLSPFSTAAAAAEVTQPSIPNDDMEIEDEL